MPMIVFGTILIQYQMQIGTKEIDMYCQHQVLSNMRAIHHFKPNKFLLDSSKMV